MVKVENKQPKKEKKSFPKDLQEKAMPRDHEVVAKEMYENLVKGKSEPKGKPPVAKRYC